MASEDITIALKVKNDDLKAKLEESKKLIETSVQKALDSNTKLSKAQNKLNAIEQRYAKNIAETKNQINDILETKAKNGKLDKTQRENLAGLNAQLKIYKDKQRDANDSQKKRIRSINNTIRANKELAGLEKAKLAGYEKEIVANKKVIAMEKKAVDTKNKSATATSNLANETIRYLRWAGTIAGVVYAAQRAWQSTIGVGIETNKIIESNTYGIAALVSANTQMVDSLGNTLTPLEKFQQGQAKAKEVLSELRIEAVKTYATFPQLIEIYQQAQGQTLSMGKAFGATVDEINKNTVKLASRMSNIAGAIGMPMDRVREEIRSLLSGNASTDSLISTMLFGSPGQANEAVRNAKENINGLTELLEGKLKPFDILADTKSFQKSVLTMQDAWSRAMSEMVEKSNLFTDLTNTFYKVSEELISGTDDIVESFDNIYDVVKAVISALDELAMVFGTAIAASIIRKTLGAISTEMTNIDNNTKKATSSVKKLSLALVALGKTNAVLIGVGAALGAISYGSSKDIKYIDEMTQKYKDMYEARVKSSSDTSSDQSLIEEYSKILAIRYEIMATSKSMSDTQKATSQAEIDVLIEQLNILGKRVDLTKEEREVQSKALEDAKKYGDLIQNISMNKKKSEEWDKRIAKHEDKIVALQKLKKEDAEVLLDIQKNISEQQEKYVQSGEKSKALQLVIKTLREEEAKAIKAMAVIDEQIQEEKQKRIDKAQNEADRRYKSELAQIRAVAKHKSVLKEIELLESGIADESTRSISLSESKIAGLTEEYAKLEKIEDKEEVRLSIYKEMLRLSDLIQAKEDKDKSDEYKGLLEANEQAQSLLESQIAISESALDWSNNLKGVAGNMQSIAQATNKLGVIGKKVEKERLKAQEQFYKKTATLQKGSVEYKKAEKKLADDTQQIEEQGVQAQIQGYGQLAGAMSTMFEQGSREAATFQAIEAGLAVVAGVRAIATQGSGDPYTAFARMAAMAASVSALLSSAGIAFGSTGRESVSYDAGSAIPVNEGKGSVFGDVDAQSKSMEKSLEILKDYAKPEYSVLSKMYKHLESIDNKMGGVTNILLREGGYAFGEGYTGGFDTGWQNNVSLGKNLTTGIGALGAGYALAGGSSALLWGGLGATALAATGIGALVAVVDKMLLGGALGDLFGGIVNSVLGGLFGKTSVKRTMSDAGIYFQDQNLEDAVSNLEGSAYQTIKTVTKKKSWFKSSKKTKYRTYYQDLDSSIENQFQMVLESLYGTTLAAGEALDTSTTDIENRLSDFVVSIGKISLKDKTGEEIQEEISSIFGKIGDDIAEEAFPDMQRFIKVGEGMFETMTRVAVGMEEAEYYIERLGVAFNDITYKQLKNTQGDVGFEALLQVITSAELKQGSENFVEILHSLSGTADDLYEAYEALDSIRNQIVFLGEEMDALSLSMIRGAGGVEQLQAGFTGYFENFLTEEEKVEYQLESLSKQFDRLNLKIPANKAGYESLLESLDLTTEAGQELYGRLVLLADGFAEVKDAQKDLLDTQRDNALEMASLERKLKEEQKSYLEDAIASVQKLSSNFEKMMDTIENTIYSLQGNIQGNQSQNFLISQFWTKKTELDKLLALDGNVTEEQASTMASLVADISKISTSIQSSFGDENETITQSLVQELDKINFEIAKDNEILKTRIVDANGEDVGVSSEKTLSALAKAVEVYNTNIEEQLKIDGELKFEEFRAGGLLSTEDEIRFRTLFSEISDSPETFNEDLADLRSELAYLSLEGVDKEKRLLDLFKSDSDMFYNLTSVLEELNTSAFDDTLSYINKYDLASSGQYEELAGTSLEVYRKLLKTELEQSLIENMGMFDETFAKNLMSKNQIVDYLGVGYIENILDKYLPEDRVDDLAFDFERLNKILRHFSPGQDYPLPEELSGLEEEIKAILGQADVVGIGLEMLYGEYFRTGKVDPDYDPEKGGEVAASQVLSVIGFGDGSWDEDAYNAAKAYYEFSQKHGGQMHESDMATMAGWYEEIVAKYLSKEGYQGVENEYIEGGLVEALKNEVLNGTKIVFQAIGNAFGDDDTYDFWLKNIKSKFNEEFSDKEISDVTISDVDNFLKNVSSGLVDDPNAIQYKFSDWFGDYDTSKEIREFYRNLSSQDEVMTDFLAPIIESLRFEREGIMVSHGNAPIKQVGGNGSGAMPQPTLVQGSYDTGTPYVPHDMTANIHEGEIIIDPQSSNVLRKYGINVNQESLMKQTKNMVEEEGYRQSRIKSTNNENYSNTKTDIIAQLEKENAVLVSGFNTLASQLDELVDFNNERRSEGYKTEVVGTVTAVGA